MGRKWIDLLLFYASLVILVTGVVLYIMPKGKVAYFTGWTLFGIDKDGWDALHIVFGMLIVIVAIWHIVYNWKIMKKYLLQKESLYALIITLGISAGTLMNIQPFKSILDLQDAIKSSWEDQKVEIPIAHAELLTLKEFCKKLNINLDSAVNKLKAKNYKFNIDETLKSISRNNNSSPVKIYGIIKSNVYKTETRYGYGRMSLKEICKKEGIKIDECLAKLNKQGIKANPDDKLKDLAFSHNLTPLDIIKIIKK